MYWHLHHTVTIMQPCRVVAQCIDTALLVRASPLSMLTFWVTSDSTYGVPIPNVCYLIMRII
jgi:hypothetical protein